jgi:hypothetical protein
VRGYVGTKNFRHLVFKLSEYVDMAPYCRLAFAAATALQATGGQLRYYRLMSIVIHHGPTIKSSHYKTIRRAAHGDAPGGAEWESWVDCDIRAATWADVVAAPAYVALYEVVDAGIAVTYGAIIATTTLNRCCCLPLTAPAKQIWVMKVWLNHSYISFFTKFDPWLPRPLRVTLLCAALMIGNMY